MRDQRGLTIAIEAASQTLLDTLGSMLLPSDGGSRTDSPFAARQFPPGPEGLTPCRDRRGLVDSCGALPIAVKQGPTRWEISDWRASYIGRTSA